MKRFIKPLTLLVATTFIFSCDPKSKEAQDGKVTINANDKSSAQDLINSAEQIVSPYSFMLAYRLSSLALEKDPTNIKAQFYNKLLKRFEAFRGYAVRIKPLLTDAQKANLQKAIDSFPKSPLKDFLTEPGTEYKNIEDLQGMYSQYFKAVSDFRSFLKEQENSEMEINLNPLIFSGEIKKELANSCRVKNQDTASTRTATNIELECDYSYAAAKKLNVADFVALRQAAAGEMILGIYFNSYSLEGIQSVGEIKGLTSKQVWDKLFANEKFGKVRSDNMIPKLKEIGSDLGAAVTWAIQYQSTICPKGQPSPENRPNYLFKSGICVKSSDELTRSLALLDSALKGVIDVDLKDGSKARIDAFAWSRSPIADLRSIEPTFDASGNKATTFKDNTLGGVFVDNNADRLLLRNQK